MKHNHSAAYLAQNGPKIKPEEWSHVSRPEDNDFLALKRNTSCCMGPLTSKRTESAVKDLDSQQQTFR